MTSVKDYQDIYPGRIMRIAWVYSSDSYTVRKAQCFNCVDSLTGEPGDYWWVPAIGFSVPGESLRATEEMAKAYGRRRLRRQIVDLEEKLEGLT